MMAGAELAAIESLWLIGCGSMGGALLDRWLACGLPAQAITVVDPAPKGRPANAAVTLLPEPPTDHSPKVLILAVKPQMLAEVAVPLRPHLGPDTLVISILAGVTAATISDQLGTSHVVRAMPNTPAQVGQGVTALCGLGSDPSPSDAAMANMLMCAAGKVQWVEERWLDAVTAISGSGPAYVYRFVEALAVAGEAEGLPAGLAAELARQTLIGAAALLGTTDQSPVQLREQVTSPNGTTYAGLQALDGDGALTKLLAATVHAAAMRSRELAQS